MFGTGYKVTVENIGTVKTIFFGDSQKYKLTVYKDNADITSKYSYKTLKTRTGVQDPADYRFIYTNSTDNMVPIPMIGGKF